MSGFHIMRELGLEGQDGERVSWALKDMLVSDQTWRGHPSRGNKGRGKVEWKERSGRSQ